MSATTLPIIEFFSDVREFIEVTDSERLEMLRDEQERAGLGDLEISLFVPAGDQDYNSMSYGSAYRDGDRYAVNLNVQRILLFDVPSVSERKVLRHELAHIKYGDCDRNVPRRFPWNVVRFLQECRAEWYAHFGRGEK